MYGIKEEHTGYGHTGAGLSLSSLNMRHEVVEREFDNLIYGSDKKDENVYDSPLVSMNKNLDLHQITSLIIPFMAAKEMK